MHGYRARRRASGVWGGGAVRSLLLAVMLAGTGAGQTVAPREPTEVFIRREAGLPAASARGQIEILDVGHHAMETMLSIVASRRLGRWRVSYACAESPACAPGADHLALAYDLSGPASAEVDAILADLAKDDPPAPPTTDAGWIGGFIHLTINSRTLHRRYGFPGSWGAKPGRLEALLKPPGANGG